MLECSSSRGIKLLEHGMKVTERVLERRLRQAVEIDKMQFGFRPGTGTTHATFIARQLQERYRGKHRELWWAFVDLEKAFDRVPKKVVEWAMRKLGVEEWLVRAGAFRWHWLFKVGEELADLWLLKHEQWL